MTARRRLSFGLVPPPSFLGVEARVNLMLRWVSERSGTMLVRRHVQSYEELEQLLRTGDLDVAWLPPIPFSRLASEGFVRELVCGERSGTASYVAVLLGSSGGKVTSSANLRGARMGWVDPLSATGYVVPRVRLAARGMDPAGLFGGEMFFGSHAGVVRALLVGAIDVAATYAGFDEHGELVRGAYQEIGAQASDFVVVESFGSIPPDVIAVRKTVPDAVHAALAAAFEACASDPAVLDAVRSTFGVLSFVREPLADYAVLRTELERGIDSGIIPAAAAFLSTRPPPSRK